jgi:hypothetical protein
MACFQIKHDPELNIERVADRIGSRLSAPMTFSIMQPAPWLSPRVLVQGGGKTGATLRLRQGPQATVLLLDRMVVSLRSRLFLNNILRLLLMFDDAGTMAAVRSILLESGEFVGPDDGRPQRIYRPGTVWRLINPGLFQLVGALKVLAGVVLAGAIVGLLGWNGGTNDLPTVFVGAFVAGLGAFLACKGIANLRLRWSSISTGLIPLIVTMIVTAGIGHFVPTIRNSRSRSAAASEFAAQREKVLSGGPIHSYLLALNDARAQRFDEETPQELFAQWSEAVNITVKRKVFLNYTVSIINAHRLTPDLADALKTTDERLHKLRDLMNRPADDLALEAKIRSRHYLVDNEEGSIQISPPDQKAEEELIAYLHDKKNISVEDDKSAPSATSLKVKLIFPGDEDKAKVKAAVAPGDPAAIPVSSFDRKESFVRTDDPECLYVIVPAQFARSLKHDCDTVADLKWDEDLYQQGKVIVQFSALDSSDLERMRAKLESWEPKLIAGGQQDWP